MNVRLLLPLPFAFQMPSVRDFFVKPYDDEGFSIQVFPVGRSDIPRPESDGLEFEIEGTPARTYDVICVNFSCESLDGTVFAAPDTEPAIRFMQMTVNYFLARLRYVTGVSSVRPIVMRSTPWKIFVLDDDGSEIEPEEFNQKLRVNYARPLQFFVITHEMWAFQYKLPPKFVAPIWHDIYLDAAGALPQVGQSVVLAWTALEVFISQTLDNLARAKDSPIPGELWHWINSRENQIFKQPSVKENFDELSKMLIGHSLKEDETLWRKFTRLRRARNTFIHSGVATIGVSAVTPSEAEILVQGAKDIIDAIREHVPDEHKWPKFDYETSVTAIMKLGQEGENATGDGE